MKLIRQGDLILSLVSSDAKPNAAEKATITLAVGEESGHSHVLDNALRVGVDQVFLAEDSTLRVEGMPWRHESIAVPAGTYRYWVEQEYTPEAIRDVRD